MIHVLILTHVSYHGVGEALGYVVYQLDHRILRAEGVIFVMGWLGIPTPYNRTYIDTTCIVLFMFSCVCLAVLLSS